MQRIVYIERILRQLYNGLPPDDRSVSNELVNLYINDGVAYAAKNSWNENIKVDNIEYLNNSFYTTYKNLAVVSYDKTDMLYQIELPEIPTALGHNQGIASLRLKNSSINSSQAGIPLTIQQQSIADRMRPIQNSFLYWYEGRFVYCKSSLPLYNYTANIKMVSGGDSTDLDSELNLPNDWIPFVNDYVLKQLLLERSQPQDLVDDGVDLATAK
jgi:hypothetical protein